MDIFTSVRAINENTILIFLMSWRVGLLHLSESNGTGLRLAGKIELSQRKLDIYRS